MQLLGRGIRCFSTVPSKVIHNWQFVLLLISIIQARGHPKVHVEVQEVEKRKAKPALEGLKFGTAFTDHMLVMEWAEAGGWQVTRIWCFFYCLVLTIFARPQRSCPKAPWLFILGPLRSSMHRWCFTNSKLRIVFPLFFSVGLRGNESCAGHWWQGHNIIWLLAFQTTYIIWQKK